MNDTDARKAELRREAKRHAACWLSSPAASEDRARLHERLVTMLRRELREGSGVALYYGYGAEYPAQILAPTVAALGGRVYLPRVLTKIRNGAKMGFGLVPCGPDGLAAETLEKHAWGMAEPPVSAVTVTAEAGLDALDLMILPTLLGDRDGYRLGHGGGYYDRFLDALRRGGQTTCRTVLPLLPWQISDSPLPRTRYDRRVDRVVTGDAEIDMTTGHTLM